MPSVRMVSHAAPVRPSALLETMVVRDARATAPWEMATKAISPRAKVARDAMDRLLVVEEVTHRDARAWAQAKVSVMEPAPATAPAFRLPPPQLKAEIGRD